MEERGMSLSLLSLSFAEHFKPLDDPRVDRTKFHSLPKVVFIADCALLCGANDFVGMEKFGKNKRGWLEKFFDMSNGVPSHDTFGRVIQALDPQQFLQCFTGWVQAFMESTTGRLINIDGKTIRASLDRVSDLKPLHVVSAWACEARLVLGQVAVAAIGGHRVRRERLANIVVAAEMVGRAAGAVAALHGAGPPTGKLDQLGREETALRLAEQVGKNPLLDGRE
jgi:hypothetical protein